MRIFWLAALLCIAGVPAAAGKHKDSEYQDAVLVDFKDVVTGSSCSSRGNVDGNVDENGKIDATTSSSTGCSNTRSRQYTLKSGDHTYIVEHKFSTGRVAAASLSPVGLFLLRGSVLGNVLPGAHVLVRSDNHGFFVKVGKKESGFDVVSAQ